MDTSDSSTEWNDELAQLTKRFLGGLPGRLDGVREQVEKGNWKEVASLIHRLKGASASYGFKEVAEEARAFEESLKKNAFHSVPEHLEKISSAIERQTQ